MKPTTGRFVPSGHDSGLASGGGRSARNTFQFVHATPKVGSPLIHRGMFLGAPVAMCMSRQRSHAIPLPFSSTSSACGLVTARLAANCRDAM